MSTIASFLMVLAGALCLAGAVCSKSRPGIAASALMLVAMIDLTLTAVLPPVAWSAVLLIIGMCLAVSLGRASAPAAVPAQNALMASEAARASRGGLADEADDSPSGSPEAGRRCLRLFPRLGRTSATLAAMAYPIMAWQVLAHGSHPDGSAAESATSGAEIAHEHSGHVLDASSIGVVVTFGATVLALLLVLCAVQAIARERRALMLECLGMAAMVSVMQFVH